MPIKFRCPHCRQFLGISRAKANSLTDCPTCGRTIRIPNLDGKVAAIPKPKLDMEDSELVRALGALANLDPSGGNVDSPEDQESSAASGRSPKVSQPSLVELLERPAPVKILPEVIEEPDEPLSIIDEEVESIADAEGKILEHLAGVKPSPPASKIIKNQKGTRFGSGSLLLACVICLLCGALIGRALFPKFVTTPNDIKDFKPPVAVAGAPGIPNQNLKDSVRVTGKLTYTAATGEALPDREARVIILPIERVGTAKLSVAGFRVGASPVDQELLKAELHALGGDYVLAGIDGTYTASVPKQGRYGILIASRYQSRSQEFLPPGPIMDFVAAYFDRPTQLLGKVQYHFQNLSGAKSAEIIDHHFDLE